MPTLSGSFSGKANWQTSVSLKDTAGHEIKLNEVTGWQNTTDAKWNRAKVTYWSTADLVSGNGTQRGYFINEHADGDCDRGTFEGRIATAGGEVTMEGTWTFSGGTGKLNGVNGNGTYRGRMTSPDGIEMTWGGTYQLAEAKTGAG